MVQYKFYNLYVHGSFVNEIFFQLLGGVHRDKDGNLHDVAGYARNPDFTTSAPPKTILEPLRRKAIAGMDLVPDDSQQAKDYEAKVLPLLRTIDKTVTGSTILQKICKHKKIVIVPFNSFDKLSRGECNASTTNRTSFGNYVRLAFTPDSSCSSESSDYPTSEDETLLHELFHAYLISVEKDVNYYDKMKESSSQEEFLAVQVTNMYRAETGRGVFQRVYGSGMEPTKLPVEVTRKQLEDYFQSDEDVLKVFEPGDITLFQALAAHGELPLNPFRNFGTYRQNLYRFRYKVQQDLKAAGKMPRLSPPPF